MPTNLPGVEIGRRHLPALHVFQNGPNWGRDVFIPMDNVIGGVEQVGKGWKMLMSALAAGRGISLPSLSAAGCAFTAHTTGAYARIREQFHVPIGRFEAIQERLGRMAATAYLLDAARRLTCAGIDHGHKPAVVTAIMKSQATERMRVSVNDAMDMHGGKARAGRPAQLSRQPLSRGPDRHHGRGRQHRHPQPDPVRPGRDPQPSLSAQGDDWRSRSRTAPAGSRQFDRRSGVMSATASPMRSAPGAAPGPAACSRRRRTAGDGEPLLQAARPLCGSAFALAVDIALLTLGGALKRQEMISARFGDILSELYLLSAALKRWEDEGRQQADLPLLAWCMESGFATIETRFDEIFANFPEPAGGVAAALPGAAARAAPPRSVRSLDARPAPCCCWSPRRRAIASPSTSSTAAATTGLARLERAFELTIASRSRCAIACTRRTSATSTRPARRA